MKPTQYEFYIVSKAHLYALDHDSPRAGSVVRDDRGQVLPHYYIDIL